MIKTNQVVLKGFEDYTIIAFPSGYIDNDSYRSTYASSDIHIIDNKCPLITKEDRYGRDYLTPVIKEHKELLESDRKVFVHPNCKLSRTLVSTKYKKCLDAWMADVVVIPEVEAYDIQEENLAVFINEDSKVVVIVPYFRIEDVAYKLDYGQEFGLYCNSSDLYNWCSRHGYSNLVNEIGTAKLIYYGKALAISHTNDWIADYITGMLPSDKLVYEKTLMESLGSEDNKVTLESLISIDSMLKSPDNDTVSVGLKAIASMDYVHYTASIVFTLQQSVYNYKYNKAMNSTVVKYMFRNFLNMQNTRKTPVMPKEIYPEDYELLKKLLIHFLQATDETIMDYLKYYPFIHVNAKGQYVPRLKS